MRAEHSKGVGARDNTNGSSTDARSDARTATRERDGLAAAEKKQGPNGTQELGREGPDARQRDTEAEWEKYIFRNKAPPGTKNSTAVLGQRRPQLGEYIEPVESILTPSRSGVSVRNK